MLDVNDQVFGQEIAFIQALEHLKLVERTNRVLGGKRFENSAEHSWQAAVLALILKDSLPDTIDMEKVVTMLLIHELGEIGAGDTFVYDEEGKATAYQREEEAIVATLSLLPNQKAQELLALWQECEQGNSPEAQYARCIDAIIPLINHLHVSDPNYNPHGITREQVYAKKAFIKAFSQPLWELTEALIEASVAKGLYC